jgi:integrase/recombinase XerD
MSNQHLIRKPAQTALRAAALPPDGVQYWIDGFLLKQRAQRHSAATIDYYRWHLDHFAWFLAHEGHSLRLADINANHIRAALIYLEGAGRWGKDQPNTNKPLTPASIHAFARALRAFFRWVTREARLEFNPFANVEMPALPNQWRVETLTDEEIVQLFAACDRMGHPFTIQRNRAVLAILLDSGLRASELLSLTIEDVQAHEGTFEVVGKGGKRRTVAIGAYARRELWAFMTHHRLKLDTQEPAVFVSRQGAPLSYYGLKDIFHRLAKLSGITRIPVKAHTCRHTFATKAHRNGMRGATLQTALGHSKFDITRRYYLDIAKEDLAAEHALYGPLDNMDGQLLAARGALRRELPADEVLATEVAEQGYRATGRRYGVSDTAIRKRLRRAGLIPAPSAMR